MNQLTRIIFTFIFLLVSVGAMPNSFVSAHSFTTCNITSHDPVYRSRNLRISDIEKMLGKKLTLREKIAFKIFKAKLKKKVFLKPGELDEEAKKAKSIAIIGLMLFFIPFFNLASIPLAIVAISKAGKVLREDATNRHARTASTLGWITLGLFLFALIFVLIIFSNFRFE